MLAVALPADAILGAWQRALYPAVPLTLLIVLAGTVLAYLLARRLRQPLLALAAAAARLEQGDFTTAVPPVREPELAPLAVQLDRARRIVAERLGAITREEARQRALFAALREPILLTSADGRIVGTNPAARSLVDGWVALEGRAIRDLFPFLADGDPADPDDPTWQGQILDRTGQTRDVEVSRAALVETSLPTGYAYVVHDVSRHVELTRMREQLLYNVAHELNGPIGVLAGAIEVLADAYADLTARDFERLIRAARRTAGHLVDLTGGLLSVGSIRSGQFAIHPEPVELGALVDTAVDTVAARLEARGQWIERVGFDAGLAVRADPRYVRQVIRNLLANASTYGPGGAPIRIVAAREGDAVRVAVEDRGPGIPAAQRQAIFERFQRGATAAEAVGTGLGLAIAREIVAAHGGQIGLEGDDGCGTRIWFTLPAAAGEGVGE
jgi:two-component system sensor histidine kinase VicK